MLIVDLQYIVVIISQNGFVLSFPLLMKSVYSVLLMIAPVLCPDLFSSICQVLQLVPVFLFLQYVHAPLLQITSTCFSQSPYMYFCLLSSHLIMSIPYFASLLFLLMFFMLLNKL